MLKISFTNGRELEYLEALETEEYWGGSNRRTLTVECAAGAMEPTRLNALLGSADNLLRLEMSNDVLGVSNAYEGYILKLEVAVKKKQTAPESPETPALYEDRLVFKLGRRTYIEEQLARLGL